MSDKKSEFECTTESISFRIPCKQRKAFAVIWKGRFAHEAEAVRYLIDDFIRREKQGQEKIA